MDSPEAVTIRILPSGPVYSSDIKRLRKLHAVDKLADKLAEKLALITAAAPSELAETTGIPAPASPPTHALSVAALECALAAKFAKFGSKARRNPHALPGTPLHARFAAAVAAAPHKKLDIMLHGSPEQNVDSILQSSLRGRAACGRCWFTDDISTASTYARGARRLVAFAVLREKSDTASICTTSDAAHHLPLFEVPLYDSDE